MKERTLMAVEELFQLCDVPRPDFPHDLFVFHCVLVYVMEYRGEAKRLRKVREAGQRQFSHR
jgi:hypothetical protein